MLNTSTSRRFWSAVLALLIAASCTGSNYGDAAVGTGVAVATVGVYRAITKDCWARCSAGYLCNQKTGLCERGECTPPCAVGKKCVRDPKQGLLCVGDPSAFSAGPDAGAPNVQSQVTVSVPTTSADAGSSSSIGAAGESGGFGTGVVPQGQ